MSSGNSASDVNTVEQLSYDEKSIFNSTNKLSFAQAIPTIEVNFKAEEGNEIREEISGHDTIGYTKSFIYSGKEVLAVPTQFKGRRKQSLIIRWDILLKSVLLTRFSNYIL